MLGCLVSPANMGDREAAKSLLRRVWLTLPRLKCIWADGNYDGPLVEWAKTCWNLDLEIVVKPAEQKGFSVLPRRWVVERTFAWLGKQRRLAKDYEERPASSVALIQIALSALMLRRLAPE
jgi:transposase